ncbi:MAG TPA: hypothetical protein VKQ30_07325 [Ktedonobacterales bacterium]|nr:hypothetical protein [Ktedonobacterales bacterium]
MPNRYEREIEEILRNLDHTEPRQGISDRIRAFNRPRQPKPRGIKTPLSRVDIFILLGILLILIGAGIAFTAGDQSLLSGLVAVAGFVLLVLGLAQSWFPRLFGSRSAPVWRGNVVDMRPPRRNPFAMIATRFRIIRLRLRYQKRRDRED